MNAFNISYLQIKFLDLAQNFDVKPQNPILNIYQQYPRCEGFRMTILVCQNFINHRIGMIYAIYPLVVTIESK